MDGYEVARGLRKASPDRDLYLMALTGYGREYDIRLARAAGPRLLTCARSTYMTREPLGRGDC
jgi:CheY-like chemotaxis protein